MLSFLSFLILVGWTFALHPVTVPSHMLLGHVYRSLQDCDWLNCIQTCHDDPNCISYNFIRSTHGLGVCEMIDCGLEDLCDIKSQLMFSNGALFQQLASPRSTQICESSTSSQVEKGGSSLTFPPVGATGNFVRLGRGIPTLSKLSVCFWIRASTRHNMGIFSYLGTKGTKEMMINVVNHDQVVFTVGGESKTIHATINDGKWHHTCTTWDTAAGSWAFFKDGVAVNNGSGLKDGYVIVSGGSLVLGQEQVTDKTFEPRPFIGELGNFNIWSDLVSAMEVSQMSKSCLKGKGNVFGWSTFRIRSGINGTVKLERPSLCAP
ncbi:neuronal pentraxin-2-like [Oculina patagonica]